MTIVLGRRTRAYSPQYNAGIDITIAICTDVINGLLQGCCL